MARHAGENPKGAPFLARRFAREVGILTFVHTAQSADPAPKDAEISALAQSLHAADRTCETPRSESPQSRWPKPARLFRRRTPTAQSRSPPSSLVPPRHHASRRKHWQYSVALGESWDARIHLGVESMSRHKTVCRPA